MSDIISQCLVLSFSDRDAECHARLWVDLESKGLPIGPRDLLIAATAVTAGFSLATLNEAEFRRGPGLNLVPVNAYKVL